MRTGLVQALVDSQISFSSSAELYLLLAFIALLIAVRFVRQALVPVGTLVQAVVAATIVALATGAALVFVVAAAVYGQVL